jgi:hypothetical protein
MCWKCLRRRVLAGEWDRRSAETLVPLVMVMEQHDRALDRHEEALKRVGLL